MFQFFQSRDRSVAEAAAERARARAARREAEAPKSWGELRRPPSTQDLLLAAHTLSWYESLPAAQRPRHLLHRYARVANRVALCWPDKRLALEVFESLLVDTRGGRRGFPAEVAAELRLLQAMVAGRPGASAARPAAPVVATEARPAAETAWSLLATTDR